MTIKDVEERTGLSRSNIRFYEKEKLIEPSRNDLDEPRKEGCPWQEMMVLTAPVSGCVGGMPCMVHPGIWHGLRCCL